MVKIQEVKERYSISLPSMITKLKGWKKGDDLYFTVDMKTGQVTVYRVEDIIED
ncbi:MAG: hypothetical protein KKG59_07440 [Nanoarchaeota archaeon]|nr:hypothetical protein [Nanoarchaeota archaeon]